MAGSRVRFPPAALAATGLDLDFDVRPTGRYRLVRKGERRAIIELVDVPLQEDYCLRLEAASGATPGRAPRMPAHVTLFTEPGGRGIALYSAEELAALSTEADLRLEPGPWRLDETGAIAGA